MIFICAEQPDSPRLYGKLKRPIERLIVPAIQALAFARAIAPDVFVTAVHVTDSLAESDQLRAEAPTDPDLVRQAARGFDLLASLQQSIYRSVFTSEPGG